MILVLPALAPAAATTAPSTAGGLSAAQLIAILAIVVTMFGMLLTAIGVLMLRTLTGLDRRISEVKSDIAADLDAVWRALDSIRTRVWGGDGERQARRRLDP